MELRSFFLAGLLAVLSTSASAAAFSTATFVPPTSPSDVTTVDVTVTLTPTSMAPSTTTVTQSQHPDVTTVDASITKTATPTPTAPLSSTITVTPPANDTVTVYQTVSTTSTSTPGVAELSDGSNTKPKIQCQFHHYIWNISNDHFRCYSRGFEPDNLEVQMKYDCTWATWFKYWRWERKEDDGWNEDWDWEIKFVWEAYAGGDRDLTCGCLAQALTHAGARADFVCDKH